VNCNFTCEVLPALDDDVNVLGVELHAAIDAAGLLAGDEGGAGAAKWFKNNLNPIIKNCDGFLW